jgi:hypothetical protein
MEPASPEREIGSNRPIIYAWGTAGDRAKKPRPFITLSLYCRRLSLHSPSGSLSGNVTSERPMASSPPPPPHPPSDPAKKLVLRRSAFHHGIPNIDATDLRQTAPAIDPTVAPAIRRPSPISHRPRQPTRAAATAAMGTTRYISI